MFALYTLRSRLLITIMTTFGITCLKLFYSGNAETLGKMRIDQRRGGCCL